jgi:UDP:flavonoid glycosyltransferase YjiC (YdhE family)
VGRILLVWQLGGNLGHITRLLGLAKKLRSRGHHVTFALENTQAAAGLLARHGFPFVQAPVLRSTASDLPREPASYPEMLFHFGFAEPQALASATRAWRALYRDLTPDLIVFDHAPTALLAARGAGIPRVVFGTGFASPPPVSPMPSIRPWQDIPLQRLEASEQRALDTANAALRAVSAPPLRVFHDLFDVEENILATLPELDHYGARHNVRYWGPIFDSLEGGELHWPEGAGQKLFVYIRANCRAFSPLVATLRKADLRAVWFAPGIAPEAYARLQSSSLRIVSNPVSIASVARAADAAVLHGGHGTTAALLLRGVPLLLLPEHVEQFLLARQIRDTGGILSSGPAESAKAVDHLTGHASFSVQAKAFANKYNRLDQLCQQTAVVARIETLVALDPAAPTAASTASALLSSAALI